MVKMVLGSSDAQASSVASLADSYSTAFNNIISAVDILGNSDNLKGSAYTNVKTYTRSVVTPLAKGMILLADAAKADTKLLPDRYRSDVGEDDLSDDTEVLAAEIAALDATINANNTALGGMEADDPNKTTIEGAVKSDTAERDKRQKKLNKINAYDAASPSFFSDIAGLEANLNSGLSLLQSGVAGFNGTFPLPSKKQLQWADSINKDYKQYQDYQSAVAKAKKGEKLSQEEAKAVEAYKKKHSGLDIDKSVTKAADKKMDEVKEKEQYESVVKKAKNGEELTDKDVQVLTAYAQSHPNEKLNTIVVDAIKNYVNKIKNHYDKNSTKYDMYTNVIEQLGLGTQRIGGLVTALEGISGPATVDAKGTSTAFILVNKSGVGQALAQNGSKIASVGKWGGRALMGIGFGLGMFDDMANKNKTVGQAVVHNGLSTGIGLGAGTAAAALVFGTTPVGWAAAGAAAVAFGVGTAASWAFNKAYENNFLGLQDGLDAAGDWLDNAGKSVGKAVSKGIDSAKNWAKDAADGVGDAISGGISALNPFD